MSLTPLLEQYHRIKEKYRDTILLFQVGDFYEMFYDDAKTGAKVLGLTLTARSHGKHNKIPLAGVPVKSIDTYIRRLVSAGFKVAICEQLEAPGLAKIIKRNVIEVITPGTIMRPTLLEDDKNQYLLGIAPYDKQYGIAFADISTGEFYLAELKGGSLNEEIQKIDPKEIVIPESATANFQFSTSSYTKTRLDDYYFSFDYAYEKLKRHFGVANLEGFGIEDKRLGISAAGAVLYYLEETQKNTLPHIRKLALYTASDYLLLDRATRKNLELTERLRDESSEGTLLWILDRTETPFGKRLLRKWLLSPSLDVKKIQARQQAVEELFLKTGLTKDLGKTLSQIGDLERIGSRIACERSNAKDLVALKNYLQVVPEVKELLVNSNSQLLKESYNQIGDFSGVVERITKTLVEEPPFTITEGGLIQTGFNQELDEIRNLAHNAKQYIAELQEQERKATGIPNLRVGYNSVFGYYIEVTKSYWNLVPKNYLRKQTLANVERFITPELKEYETKVLNAEERIKTLEYEIFIELRREIAQAVPKILELSKILAQLDVFLSLAIVARENNYVKPEINSGTEVILKDSRHPVVEKLTGEPFIPNDCYLDNETRQILLITGPNMAGKSTYLRQVALIIIMAQIGSFVPVAEARIGIVDKIFTRIGASDDLSRGVSTFLAEMNETANILNNATSRSLVILDEVGRGTATYDGLAIAWAVVEYLHGNSSLQAKTLFATHYHELTDIATILPRVKNYNFTVKEYQDEIIFLRKLVEGKSDRSYGIAVAKLAGLPREVIDRAKIVLEEFEKGEELSVKSIAPDKTSQISLFYPQANPILDELGKIDLNKLTPIEALNLIAEFQKKLKGA
ncbi:MAG: DNA mismatch repair protein MutS [candidate division WOR-3 bacterium]|nr:DNA mismatch repair protein MutS [candidate division WOR-3 bacterium]